MSSAGAGRNRTIATAVIAVIAVLGWLLWPDDGTSTGDAPVPTIGSAAPASTAGSRSATDPETGLRWVELAALPTQAQQTVSLIRAGGPYPYSRDGITFSNREHLLPRQPSGYYREFTVPTPGSQDRGARRIVTGDRDASFFYTGDHYVSFQRIRVGGG